MAAEDQTAEIADQLNDIKTQVKEINALAAFYASPEGRSITKKFGAYIADVMPAIQEEMAQAMSSTQETMRYLLAGVAIVSTPMRASMSGASIRGWTKRCVAPLPRITSVCPMAAVLTLTISFWAFVIQAWIF